MKALSRSRSAFSATLLLAVTFSTRAQVPVPQTTASSTTSAPAAPSFEVASVRLSNTDPVPFTADSEPLSRFPTNHFYARNLPLKLILGIAFGVDQRYVDGDPAWLDTQNYFVEAKVDGGQQLTSEQMKPLLQNLLARRLGVKAHRESRLVAGYEMVVAKDGPKLQPSKGDLRWGSAGPDRVEGAKENAADMAIFFSYAVRQPVVEKTGLTGSYDFKLSFAPLNSTNAPSNLPDFFTAIQEQLGLKLVPAKVPVDYLVIDHVDRVPIEN